MLGKITNIEEVTNFEVGNNFQLNGSIGARLGMTQMISSLSGSFTMDGYRITTDKHTFLLLIDNGQSCCESWGYFSSEDDVNDFIGAELREVNVVDKALNVKAFEENLPYGPDEGGAIFVNFETDRGTFQLTVYNAHNGYYGHEILLAKGEGIIERDTI